MTNFAEILRTAVQATPGALGGAFAAYDGELVDQFPSTSATQEWPILAAHYGIILQQAQRALLTFHYGDIQWVLICHEDLDVMVYSVQDGYYALLATPHPGPVARAATALAEAARALRKEMS